MQTDWEHMPERIILLRHGQSEANVDHSILATKPDHLVELTEVGRTQAFAAGERIRRLLPSGSASNRSLSVVVSPFERAQQTLRCVLAAVGGDAVSALHVDPRVREQEFGNLQGEKDMKMHAHLAATVGRFYYRRPDGESSADVFDRADEFWIHTFTRATRHRFERRRISTAAPPPHTQLIVTHGLTMRVLLMSYFQWSVDTFEAVYNPGNGDMWVLKKAPHARKYELCASECSPPMLPWATRPVRLEVSSSSAALSGVKVEGDAGEGSASGATRTIDLTLIDYLSLPAPRTADPAGALRSSIRGHGHQLDAARQCGDSTPEARLRFVSHVLAQRDPIEYDESTMSIDWWCGKLSAEARALRGDGPLDSSLRMSAMRRGSQTSEPTESQPSNRSEAEPLHPAVGSSADHNPSVPASAAVPLARSEHGQGSAMTRVRRTLTPGKSLTPGLKAAKPATALV